MRIRIGTAVIGVLTAASIGSAPLVAQQPGGPGGPPGERRAELEQRLRERTGQVVRRQLELTDEQMTRLQAVNAQFENQRREIGERERQAHMALRQELSAGAGANQQKVTELIDQTLRAQRQRLDVVESEQRELARFLTPVQRAKYLALQNQMRNRVQELRQRSMQRGRGPMGRPGPGARGPRRPGMMGPPDGGPRR